MSDHTFNYIGDELDLFNLAVNWKRYWKQQIRPYMGKTVLEVGAGIGGTTRIACDHTFEQWLGLEPDGAMVKDLQQRKAAGEFPAHCEFQQGTIADLDVNQCFDSILYIDVLEHIEHDAEEVQNAIKHLQPNGHLTVLSPAYQWLCTPFDKAIGHYRRYTRKTITQLTPQGAQVRKCFYLDTVGMLASLGNKLLLRASMPTEKQILFWDNVLVPVSKIVDPLVGCSFGRSVICIWQRLS